jgi:hypothetical protein
VAGLGLANPDAEHYALALLPGGRFAELSKQNKVLSFIAYSAEGKVEKRIEGIDIDKMVDLSPSLVFGRSVYDKKTDTTWDDVIGLDERLQEVWRKRVWPDSTLTSDGKVVCAHQSKGIACFNNKGQEVGRFTTPGDQWLDVVARDADTFWFTSFGTRWKTWTIGAKKAKKVHAALPTAPLYPWGDKLVFLPSSRARAEVFDDKRQPIHKGFGRGGAALSWSGSSEGDALALPGGTPSESALVPLPGGRLYLEHLRGDDAPALVRRISDHQAIARLPASTLEDLTWSGDGNHIAFPLADDRIGVITLP